MSSASQARKRRGPDDLAISAFERGNYTSFSACGIPYFVGDVVEKFDDLVVRTPSEFAGQGIHVRIRHEVVAIDTSAARVTVRDLESGSEAEEAYDQLMIATG